MKRIVCGLLAAALLSLGLGCSSDKDKGINSNKEKPKGGVKRPNGECRMADAKRG